MQSLDLPQGLAAEATEEYNNVAAWLRASDSPLTGYSLALYPQGSFRLGTPVRPVVRQDEFDIDLVCEIGIAKDSVSQERLKKMVGDRLKADAQKRATLRERRRCWTLGYAKRFHLDVLPTIPDVERGGTCVLLTDTELRHWQHSNPNGYAAWFYGRMHRIDEARATLAKSLSVTVDRVPEWWVRTALQRSVQVLKRHRDVHFEQNLDSRPVSVILTTLAGHAYRGEGELLDALQGIIEGLDAHVETRDGKWVIRNPANEEENFADKWNERPALRDAFMKWRDQVYDDIDALTGAASVANGTLLLEKAFRIPNAAGGESKPVRMSSATVAPTPAPGNLGHRKSPPWPARLQYVCRAQRRVYLGSGSGQPRAVGSRVPKNVRLEFSVLTDAPPPYEVQWQVTNTGSEARAAGDLRGEFYLPNAQSGSRSENTKYYGTHVVQAFVVKDGRLVAKSDELLVQVDP